MQDGCIPRCEKMNELEKWTEILMFLIPFLIFTLLLANSLNVVDFVFYANVLEQSFKNGNYLLPFQTFGAYGGNTEGLSKNSLYIAISYPFVYIFSNLVKMDIEFTLNIFSAFLTSLSVLFVYKISRLFFDIKISLISSIIYILIPFIFFNGINATTYSLQLLTSSVWIYLLLKAIKNKNEKLGIISSIFFVVNIFASLSGIPLVIVQIYGLTKISRRFKWLVKNFAILTIVVIVAYYFSFVNKAYPTTFNLMKIFFMSLLFIWESSNGLSIIFFMFIVISFFYIALRILKRKTDCVDEIFTIAFICLLPSLIIFHFIPIANFTPIFAFLPILFMKTFQGNKYFKIYVLLIIIFALIKIVPIDYELHMYPHPHKEYSIWLNEIAQGSIVVAGHECSWIQYYTNLTFVCRTRNLQQIDIQNKKIILTEEYFKNENQMEFEYLVNSFNIPFTGIVEQELEKVDMFTNKTFMKIAEYPNEVRLIEDPYQWLYTVYPNIYTSFFINLEFLKPNYAIYSIME